MRKGMVDPLVLVEIVRRIFTCANPDKIIFSIPANGEKYDQMAKSIS